MQKRVKLFRSTGYNSLRGKEAISRVAVFLRTIFLVLTIVALVIISHNHPLKTCTILYISLYLMLVVKELNEGSKSENYLQTSQNLKPITLHLFSPRNILIS